jgi:hypothetical protein
MAGDELIPGYGRVERGISFTAPSLAGSAMIYAITEKSDHWTCERLKLTAGPFVLEGKTGRANDGDAAHEWVENDWKQFRNYVAWLNYMANNPPPA